MKKYYLKILGINEASTLNEIKKAYYQKAKQFHPDINKSTEAHEKFVEINKAYEYLLELKNPKPIQKSKSSSKRDSQASKTEKRYSIAFNLVKKKIVKIKKC